MATLTGPLMSLGARGSIAKSVTFSKWKGINTARQTVAPTNPNSTAQQAQRGIMSNAVAFWRSFLIGADGKESWNRDASNSGKAQSGFNAFTSAACKIQAEVANASMAVGVNGTQVASLIIDLKNIDDGADGDEAGNFTLTVGSSISQMLKSYTGAIIDGSIEFNVSADFAAGDIVYAQMTKTAGTIEAAKRSGVFKITLTV